MPRIGNPDKAAEVHELLDGRLAQHSRQGTHPSLPRLRTLATAPGFAIDGFEVRATK